MPEIVIYTTMVADDESATTSTCKLLAQESPVTGIRMYYPHGGVASLMLT